MSVQANQVVRSGGSWKGEGSGGRTGSPELQPTVACPSAALVLPGMVSFLPLSIKGREKVLGRLLGHTEVQVFARIGWGASRARWILSPRDSRPPPLWACLPPCGSHHCDAFMEHPLSASGLPAPSTPGVLSPGDGGSLGMWVGAPGATAVGQKPQCGAAGVLSLAQTHDWASENAAHYPAHRAQRSHAGTQQARRPGWEHWVPATEGKDVPGATGQLSHAGMRTISSGPTGDKDTEKRPGGSSPQARADHPA